MRLTEKQENTYVLKAGNTPKNAVQKLGAYEDMYDRLTAEYEKTADDLDKLKSQGKTKSVTYNQLFANKLKIRELISRFEIADSAAER